MASYTITDGDIQAMVKSVIVPSAADLAAASPRIAENPGIVCDSIPVVITLLESFRVGSPILRIVIDIVADLLKRYRIANCPEH
jgi:hypothetical protein